MLTSLIMMAVALAGVAADANSRTMSADELLAQAAKGPSLVMTREQAQAAKRRIAEDADAAAWWKETLSSCERELARAVVLPARGGQWGHWYNCRKCGADLKTKSPTEHVCVKCGEMHTGWPYDDVLMARQHNDNALAVRRLGIAYLLTDDARYARRAAEWLVAYADHYLDYPRHNQNGNIGQPGNTCPGKGGHVLCQVLEESVWLLRMAQGYDCVAGTLTSGEREKILTKLIRPAADVVLSERGEVGNNHECWHLAAFGSAGLVLGDRALVDRALNGPVGLFRQLEGGILSDGIWCEGSWDYHFYTMRALTPFVQTLTNLGLPAPERYRLMFTGPFGRVTPTWQLPAVNDADRRNFRPGAHVEFYEHAFAWWGDAVFGTWCAAGSRQTEDYALYGRAGRSSAKLPWRSDPFPASGGAVLRSRSGGEKPGDPPGNFVAVDYGEHGGWHGHYDKLNLILYGNGELLAEDPGSIGYGNPRHFGWYRTTLAHNALTVDGRHQDAATGKLLAFSELPDGAAIAVDAGEIAKGVRAGRATALQGNLVVDLVWADSDAEHAWEWAFHSRGEFSTDGQFAPFRLPPPEQPMLNGRPTDSDGTDAWRWVRDTASREHGGTWCARWKTPRTDLRLFHRSGAGVLTTGEGSAQPASESFRLVANRVRGKSATFASVMTLDGTADVDVGAPQIDADGARTLTVRVGGRTHRLTVDGAKGRISLD